MKLTRNTLKELIRQSIEEIDFKDQESFKKYQSQHKMRPTTKVNIGGKDTTVGQASGEEGGGEEKSKSPKPSKAEAQQNIKDATKKVEYLETELDKATSLKGYQPEEKRAEIRSNLKKAKSELKTAKDVIDKNLYSGWEDDETSGDTGLGLDGLPRQTKKKVFSQITQKLKNMFMGESVNKPLSRKRTTVKEVKKWFKTLEENRYKKTYASDARRVSWLVNNSLSEDYEAMPVSMKKKWPKAAYKRERFLAKEFVKHLRTRELEQEMKLKESIRRIVGGLITEDQYGATDKKFVNVKIDNYAPNTREHLGVSLRSLDGAAYGFGLSEDSEMDDPGPAKKAHEAYNKWAKGMGSKLQKLYKELDKGWKVYHDTFDKERKKGYK